MTGLFTPPSQPDDSAALGYAPLGGMVIDATGHITYDFAGHIKALGLDLLADHTVATPADRQVRWLRETDNAIAAKLEAFDGNGTGVSGLQISAPLIPGPASSVVGVSAGGQGVDLIRSDGGSSFLQLESTQQLRIALRSVTVTWPGGTPSATFVVTHGLPFTPTFVAPFHRDNNSSAVGAVNGITSTQLNLLLYNPPGSPGAGTNDVWAFAAFG